MWLNKTVLIGILFLASGINAFGQETHDLVTDIDGNVYHTVTIGQQVWMVENLKTTRYRNGDPIGTTDHPWIGETRDGSILYDNYAELLRIWRNTPASDKISPKYQWPAFQDERNVVAYGRLYTWGAVNDSRNIAPVGWHMPSKDEWQTLIHFLGGDTLAAAKLREVGTEHWEAPNAGATNSSGFSARASGRREYSSGMFVFTCTKTYFWSSTEDDSSLAWSLYLPLWNDRLKMFTSNKNYGFSIRCIKD